MTSPELKAQIKRLHYAIENTLQSIEANENPEFFRALLQKQAIELYSLASLLSDQGFTEQPVRHAISFTEKQTGPVIPVAPAAEPAIVAEPVVTLPTPESAKQNLPAEEVLFQPEEPIRHAPPVSPPPAPEPVKPIPVSSEIPKTQAKTPEPVSEEVSVNERFSKSKLPVMNYADKSKETPIKDLAKAISIGKKFEFINGLFDGNSEAYKNCLNTAQNAGSYEEAILHLESEIAEVYDWEENEKLAAEFFSLIRRRHMS